tara:strand:- start:2625 stop:3053 length:429 start_codon:yes stop_codon:yes gene_type:complete
MDFLDIDYIFKNKDGQSFRFKIIKKEDKFFSISEIVTKGQESLTQEMEVFPIKANYIESKEITMDDVIKQGGDAKKMVIADKPVEAFKLKCKFKGKVLSPVSSILVLHKNFKHWVTYPFDMVGTLQESCAELYQESPVLAAI